MANDTYGDVNTLIETIFANFTVDDKDIPVRFLNYEGHEDAYIVYTVANKTGVLRADDDVQKYLQTVEFGIYSKGNYTNIVNEVKSKLKANNFMWQPEGDLEDMYNVDTGYYIKVMSFAIERSI